MNLVLFLRKVVCWSVLVLCISSIGSASASIGYGPAGFVRSGYGEAIGPGAIPKILSILETRNADRKVMEKTAEKLLTMNQTDIRLISSLCDRIAADRRAAGADIAFSLITAMIVLS